MLKRYLHRAFIVGIGLAIFGVCFTFVKAVRADAKEAERLVTINELIQCGIEKMSPRAKQVVAEAEYERRMAALVKDTARVAESELSMRPVFVALVDSCGPVDREQRREAIGWFKYSLEHDAEYRAIYAPLAEQYRQAAEKLAAAEAGHGSKSASTREKEMAWVFKK